MFLALTNHICGTSLKGQSQLQFCTLLHIGWSPVSPDRWLAEGSWATISGAPFAKAQILAQAQQDLIRKLWQDAAAKHNHNSGLESGGYLFPAKKAKASLIKEGNYSAARALDFIVTGAMHDPPIPQEGPVPIEYLCNRCDWMVPATRKHCLIECLGNDLIDHPHMHKTRWVIQQALAEWDKHACLYARGIVPLGFIKQPDEIDYLSAKVWASDNFDKVLALTGRAYSDGSGGPEDVPRSVSQVSFGAVCFDFQANGPQTFAVSRCHWWAGARQTNSAPR